MKRLMMLLALVAATLLVVSGVALAVTKVGTGGPDTLRGTNKADNLLGKGGDDVLLALAGKDTLSGGPGKDLMFGGDESRPSGGDKTMSGGPGNDAVFGGNDSDSMAGGEGNDLLVDEAESNPSKDALSGGEGTDVFFVWTRPAGKDVVSCGAGFDRVFADARDSIAPDCEKVVVGRSLQDLEAFVDSIPQSFFDGLP